MAEEQKQEKMEEGKWVPIHVEGAEEIPMSYVNHIFVTHTTDEFFVTFSQIHPPYLLPPVKKEQVAQVTYIPAKVVARVALTPSKMKELIDTLGENYKNFLKKQVARK